jgi:PPE family protein
MVSFPMLPPEINSLLMFGGAGSAPMLEAAAAWEGLADELEAAADSFASVTSGLVGQAWQGPASRAMAAAAAPYAGWLKTASAQAVGAAGQAKAVAGAFEVNTFLGSATDTGLPNSGFNNTGTGTSGFGNTGDRMSGFLNTAKGGTDNEAISGFSNLASGGSSTDGGMSGFFNTAVTQAVVGHPIGEYSAFNSGLFNIGSGIAGLFNLGRL